MRRLFSVAAFLLVMGLAPPIVGAQDATPEVDLVTPDPAECVVEPRSIENILSYVATPSADGSSTTLEGATPESTALPEGEPASEEIVAGVTDTVHEIYACLNANSFLQVFALYTDEYVARSVVEEGITEYGIGLLATPIAPQGADERDSFAVRDVQVLDDGRVGAYIVSSNPLGGGTLSTTFEIFVEQDGRYLVDEIIFLPNEG